LITSAEKGLVAGTSGLVKAAFDGTIKGGNFDGTTGISDYHDLASVVPADVQSEVEKVVAGLKDKSILTGVTLG
jgi:basic membrane protein A